MMTMYDFSRHVSYGDGTDYVNGSHDGVLSDPYAVLSSRAPLHDGIRNRSHFR
jgi:hypothetical protein